MANPTHTFVYDTLKKQKYLGALVAGGFGFVLFDVSIFIGIPLLALAFYLPFTSDGLEIDLDAKLYRHYKSSFGVHRGKWLSLENYSVLLILLKHGQKELVSPRGAVSTYHDYQEYEVMIANASHRRQLFLKAFQNKEEAVDFAQRQSEELGYPIETYKPNITKKTKGRRR